MGESLGASAPDAPAPDEPESDPFEPDAFEPDPFEPEEPADYVADVIEFEPIDGIGPIALKESGERPRVAPISAAHDDEEPLVYLTSMPDQPDLGRTRIAIVGVVSALFGVALVFIACILVMRLLGI